MGFMVNIGEGSVSDMGHGSIDHSGMDHGGMDHGGMHHGDEATCSMDMLFTWNWKNRCIIFKWWHVKTAGQFVMSIVALIVLAMGYEYLKFRVANWEAKYVASQSGLGSANSSALKRYKTKQSVFYGLQIGYSFMLMLVFMSYSGWFMIAVVVGAGIGKYIWGGDSALRDLACH